MRELERACKAWSQREVARRLGVSPTTINLVLKGKYPNPKRIVERAKELFGNDRSECECPVLGVIHAEVCDKYREWAKDGAIKRDRLYMQVRSYCNDCNYIKGKS